MAADLKWIGPDVVGRAVELGELAASLNGVFAGTAGTVVVSGDAGVGKTTLAKRACVEASAEAWVLSGAGLPLASVTVPLLALRSALQDAPQVAKISTPVFGTGSDAPRDAVFAIDDWLTALCRIRPVVLMVDDLHWADQDTLDVLMYLIAGPGDRRLSILATLRNGEVRENHPLQRWLADIRRMPRITWMELGKLDYAATGAQLAQVLGAAPHQSLVREVFSHTAGNAYLNRLIVDGLRAEARHLPTNLPTDLKTAVLRSWYGLSGPARELTERMAVGGRPIQAHELDGLADKGGPRHGTNAALHEAEAAGIVDCDPDGTHWWFHHPLIAEVLEQGLHAEQRRHWHGLFAARGERLLEAGSTADFESLAALAQHHEAAGNTAQAYRWILRATDLPEANSQASEVLRLLRRALDLHGRMGSDVGDDWAGREKLLGRIRTVAEATGAMEVELEAVEDLLSGLESAQRPLDIAVLLVRRTHLRFSTGRAFISTRAFRPAVLLSSADQGSWQHAMALAELAHAGLWENLGEAPQQAMKSLEIARRTGNPRALTYASSAAAMAAVFDGRPEDGRVLGAAGVQAAAQARDFWAFVHATLWQANATEAWSSRAFADLMRAGRQILIDLGAPHVYIAKLASDEASSYMAVGRWRECSLALRTALGSDPGIMGDVGVRLTAARLAVWQGQLGEAQAHLARAEELYADKSEFLNLEFDAVHAEYYLASGNLEAAYSSAMTGAGPERRPPTMCEWLIPLAARSLADRIQLAADQGRSTARLLALIDDLLVHFPAVLQESGLETEFYSLQVKAFNLLYRAEVGRARSTAGNGRQWVLATDACQAASLLWEEAYCCWRAVQTLLFHGHSDRALATTLLRRGLELAGSLEAQPIRQALGELADRARIPTMIPSSPTLLDGSKALPGLTAREREVLVHVVAGRTYGEIAKSLVISEKTVSTHISSMLRKTGTSNRLDLARLASRRRILPTDRHQEPT